MAVAPLKTVVMMEVIPFSEQSDAHLLVPARLAKTPLTLIVDTGCSKTVLGDHLGLSTFSIDEEESQMLGVGGSLDSVLFAEVDNLRVGRLRLPELVVSILDLSHLREVYSNVLQREIDGLLGSDILSRCEGIISFRTEKLTLHRTW